MSHTATIGFDLPSDVFLTSALGGVFGAAPTTVSEPATLALLGASLAALGALRRRRSA